MSPIQRIQLVKGDITQTTAEAIVTAANEALRGGGGVDGAIHNAAGPKLVRASMSLAPCPAGEARITDGFELSARFVIHAVGPIFSNLATDGALLSSAYESSLKLAEENGVSSIAFPCISTGAYGFPADPACRIAVSTVVSWLESRTQPNVVIFCCFEPDDYDRYLAELTKWGFELGS